MSFTELARITVDLPYALREQILNFAAYIEDVADDLFEAAGVDEVSETQTDQLVYAAGIWRLWQSINSQASLLDNSLALLSGSGAQDVQLGSNLYSRNSSQYTMLTSLRNELQQVLRQQGLAYISTSRSIPELVRNIVHADGH